MKFLAYAALIFCASAVTLDKKQAKPHPKLAAKAKVTALPDVDKMEKWAKKQWRNDKEITWEMVESKLNEWAANHSETISEDEWALMEAGFDLMDITGDGKISKKEFKCVVKGKGCEKNFSEIEEEISSLHLTKEEKKAVKQWVKAQFSDEEAAIRWDEIERALEGVELTDNELALLKAAFNAADTSGDEKVTEKELMEFLDMLDLD